MKTSDDSDHPTDDPIGFYLEDLETHLSEIQKYFDENESSEELAEEEQALIKKDAREELEALAVLAEQQKLDQARSIHWWRVGILIALFALILFWLGTVLCFISRAGTRVDGEPIFVLSDGVLIAFITSTTANVLGLFFVAGRWLYPNHKSEEKGNVGKR